VVGQNLTGIRGGILQFKMGFPVALFASVRARTRVLMSYDQ